MMKHLNKQQSQIRFSCVQLAEYLFKKSKKFRELLLSNGEEFLQLTTQNLPFPSAYARKTKELASALIKHWHSAYKAQHHQLESLKALLETLESSLEPEVSGHDRNTAARNRVFSFQKKMYEKYIEEFNSQKSILSESIKQCENCLKILIPYHEDLAPCNDVLLNNVNKQEMIKSYGLGTSAYKLDVEISTNAINIERTSDTEPLFDILSEHSRIIEKFPYKLNTWLSLAAKVDVENENERENFIKELIDTRNNISEIMRKIDRVLIDEDEDEVFLEVPLKDQKDSQQKNCIKKNLSPVVDHQYLPGYAPVYKNSVDSDQVPYHKVTQSLSDSEDIDQPTSSSKDPSLIELFKIAPEVPYGHDLTYWSKSNVSFQDISLHPGLEFQHRFYGSGPDSSERQLTSETVQKLKQRTICMKSQRPGHIPLCSVMLSSGKLCQRRDIEKCPIHGKIIPRDSFGIPLNQEEDNLTISKKPVWEGIYNFLIGRN